MVQLHFANLAPSAIKATMLSILGADHVFTRNETMQAYIAFYGTREGWTYPFSLIIITDKTKEELQHLEDVIYLAPSDSYINKYTFVEPEYDSADYWTLRNTGQIHLTFAEFEKYMRLT